MSETVRADSPLQEIPYATQAGLTVQEIPHAGYINLRGQTDDAVFLQAVQTAAGTAPPLQPNHVNRAGRDCLLWMAPTEWLLVTQVERKQALIEQLEDALQGRFAGITDVSGYYTTLAVAGRDARDLLARGCPLDLHPRAFAPGECAQTLFAKATVTLHQVDDMPRFHMIVRRSFADYVWRWLQDAAGALGRL